MSKPGAQVQAALSRIDDRWDAARTERTLTALHTKRRQRRRRAQQLSAAVGLSVLAALSWRVSDATPEAHKRVLVAPRTLQPLHMELPDGSEVTLRDAQSRVVAHNTSGPLVELELVTGQAHFEVTPNKQRLFRVQSGDVRIEVLGTAFEVEREAGRSHVTVSRGRVAVICHGERSELVAGDSGWFPRVAIEPTDATTPLVRPRHSRKPSVASSSIKAAATSGAGWRETAEAGDFEHAYELLQHTQVPPTDSVEELLLAADTARISGHPTAALPFLKRVISEHAGDSRAPLAAFTLGGILMQQLARPHEAEAAYARARELSPSSALAEDALARQVEAASRAGDAARAAALARDYLEHYPTGRRVHAVRRFGNLSAD